MEEGRASPSRAFRTFGRFLAACLDVTLLIAALLCLVAGAFVCVCGVFLPSIRNWGTFEFVGLPVMAFSLLILLAWGFSWRLKIINRS